MPRRSADGELGGADVHAAVDLHRVGVDDLAAQPLGQVERQRRSCRRRSAPTTATIGDTVRQWRHGGLVFQRARVLRSWARRQGEDADEFPGRAKAKLTEDLVDQHGDKISEGIDKAADVVDDKTGGKLRRQDRPGAGKAKDALDSLDGKNDDIS